MVFVLRNLFGECGADIGTIYRKMDDSGRHPLKNLKGYDLLPCHFTSVHC